RVIDFFFSSRRRHTRSKRDWSSDVCSSDLGAMLLHGNWACSDFEAMGDKVDLTRIPALDGTDYMDYMYSQPNINLIIPSYSENRSEERRVGKERRSRG